MPPSAAFRRSALLEAGMNAFRRKRYEECIRFSEELIRIDPENPDAWNNLCAARNALGRFTEGREAGIHAIRLRPDFPLARNNLAWSEKCLAASSLPASMTGILPADPETKVASGPR